MTSPVANCDGCGACCMGQNLVPLSDISLARLEGIAPPRIVPTHLVAQLETIIRGPLSGCGDEPCVWLNRGTGKCKHHKFRPDICRNFEVGSENCLRRRRMAGMDKATDDPT